jgi:DMSO/TMAO reductase YedYZ molybdopterin-dependent catalytic subunit
LNHGARRTSRAAAAELVRSPLADAVETRPLHLAAHRHPNRAHINRHPELIRRVEPTGNAKFIEFYTLADPKQMPGLSSSVLAWPYTEGLRMDEANNPLTLLTFGLYGELLPNQNGAPVRLVVPWKYGFKSAKSLVKIRFVEKQPVISWNRAAPQ